MWVILVNFTSIMLLKYKKKTGLEGEEKVRYISLSVSDILVRHYPSEYGKAKVTIGATNVTLERTE